MTGNTGTTIQIRHSARICAAISFLWPSLLSQCCKILLRLLQLTSTHLALPSMASSPRNASNLDCSCASASHASLLHLSPRNVPQCVSYFCQLRTPRPSTSTSLQPNSSKPCFKYFCHPNFLAISSDSTTTHSQYFQPELNTPSLHPTVQASSSSQTGVLRTFG